MDMDPVVKEKFYTHLYNVSFFLSSYCYISGILETRIFDVNPVVIHDVLLFKILGIMIIQFK